MYEIPDIIFDYQLLLESIVRMFVYGLAIGLLFRLIDIVIRK